MGSMQFSQEQQDAIDNCDGNIYMAAGPGSGKSTTLAEIARKIHNIDDNRIILITFTNKSARDILGKVGLGDSPRITGGTFHSIAYRLMRAAGVKTTICDENKKKLIIKKVFDCRKDKEKFVEVYETISRTKSVYPRKACNVTDKYNQELKKYDMMDFDDIISNGIQHIKNETSNVAATHILVDELQDTSGAQLELLKALRSVTKAKMLGVGDLDQCQPKGTLVLTTQGYKDISYISSGVDRLPSYVQRGSYVVGLKEGYTFKKSRRSYSGFMYDITTDSYSTKCTYNHKLRVKWSSDAKNNKDINVVYLMKKDSMFRIGRCQLFNSDKVFHLGIRAKLEEATDIWILKVCFSKQAASLWENVYSCAYGIPMIPFKKSGKIYTQSILDETFTQINVLLSRDESSIEMKVLYMLNDFKLSIEYPLWSSNKVHEKQGASTIFEVQACNLVDDLMVIPEHVKGKKIRWSSFNIGKVYVENEQVYSINICPHHTYIADGIIVSNSIYEWRGARPQNVKDFIDTFGCKVYQLGLNFRSTQKIVEHSKKLIKHNKGRIEKNLRASSEDRGIVLSYRAKDVYKEIDYVTSYCRRNRHKEIAILYRTRLNKMKIEFELRKIGIKYKVNDSTDIVDRSAFRVLLGMLRMSCGIYDIYDMEEVAKGMKALGKTAVEKVRAAQSVTKVAADGEQVDLFEKIVTTFDDLVHNVYHKNKGMRRSLGNIMKLQAKFKELKGDSMNKLIRILPDYCTPSFDIPEDILTFLLDITKEYTLVVSNVRELCNDFGLDKDQEEDNDDALLELSTIHGYKGGERDIIILPFCNWDVRPDDKVKNVWEAERRLFYVAITRPKDELIVTYSGEKPQYIREMGL